MTGRKVGGFGRTGNAVVDGDIQSGRRGSGRFGRSKEELKRASAQLSSLCSIWSCSCTLTVVGGVYRAFSDWLLAGNRRATARLTTVHQIGIVFDRESGNRFPALVESTMMTPLCEVMTGRRWRFARRRLKFQFEK